MTSIFTTALDFGTLVGLVQLLHVDYVVATFVGSIVGFLANFAINRYWAFDASQGPAHWQFVRVLPVQAGSSGLQTLGVWLFTDFANLRYWVAKIVVSALVYAGWNYPMNRFWVFRSRVGAPVTSPASAASRTYRTSESSRS